MINAERIGVSFDDEGAVSESNDVRFVPAFEEEYDRMRR